MNKESEDRSEATELERLEAMKRRMSVDQQRRPSIKSNISPLLKPKEQGKAETSKPSEKHEEKKAVVATQWEVVGPINNLPVVVSRASLCLLTKDSLLLPFLPSFLRVVKKSSATAFLLLRLLVVLTEIAAIN